jgi:phage tail sheath protein FI
MEYPGVYIEEISGGVHSITGVATSIAAFVGWAPQGPTDRAVLVESPSDYARQFGGLVSGALLGYAVNHFFNNGGRQAYIVRLVDTTGGKNGAVLAPATPGFHTALNANGTGTGGVRLLDDVSIFNLLCVPGETDATTISQLQTYCRGHRAFYIVDCQQTDTFKSLQCGPTGLTGPDSINSAFYFPWVNAPDPLQQGQIGAYPPCGFVAGIYAATDAKRGVWKAPAGVEAGLKGASGLTFALTDPENSTLDRQAINCLRNFSIYGNVVWGARTLRGDDRFGSEWKYVPIRRLALFLESSLYAGTQWVVFEPNDERLWSQIRLNVGAFMQGLFLQGAFQGGTPQDAYFVKCDAGNNPPSSIAHGVVNIQVGFAPLRPAEFVVIQIQQKMASQGHPPLAGCKP